MNKKELYQEIIKDRKKGMTLEDLTIKYMIAIYDLHEAISLMKTR